MRFRPGPTARRSRTSRRGSGAPIMAPRSAQFRCFSACGEALNISSTDSSAPGPADHHEASGELGIDVGWRHLSGQLFRVNGATSGSSSNRTQLVDLARARRDRRWTEEFISSWLSAYTDKLLGPLSRQPRLHRAGDAAQRSDQLRLRRPDDLGFNPALDWGGSLRAPRPRHVRLGALTNT